MNPSPYAQFASKLNVAGVVGTLMLGLGLAAAFVPELKAAGLAGFVVPLIFIGGFVSLASGMFAYVIKRAGGIAALEAAAKAAAAPPMPSAPRSSGSMPATALEGISAGNFRNLAVSRPAPDRLIIAPSLTTRLFGFVFVGLGVAVAFAGVAGVFLVKDGGVERVMPLFVGVIFTLVGLGFGASAIRIEFDRTMRRLRFRRFWWSAIKEWPFTALTGVQLIDGGWHGNKRRYFTYQLNLGLTDRETPRLNLANHPDAKWSVEAGKEIATLAGIPFHDLHSPTPPDE